MTIRLPFELRSQIEEWAARQDDEPTRSDAIRRLLEKAFEGEAPPIKRATQKSASRAVDMASDELDRMADGSASAGEQAKRKRRLLKGPIEFRQHRQDLAKTKRPKPR